MRKPTTKEPTLHDLFGADPPEDALRSEVRGVIERVLDEETTAILGAGANERVATCCGCRNGDRPRMVTTSLGPTLMALPRATLWLPMGEMVEWQPRSLPRYQRRTAGVGTVLFGTYLAGGNTRRLAAALRPMLRSAPLSKDTVSQVVRRLRDASTECLQRDLRAEGVAYLYLDVIAVKVRCWRRVLSLPIRVAVGVTQEGEKRLLALRPVGSDSTAA